MAKYLLECKYTYDGIYGVWTEGGSARVAAVTDLIESLNGTLESCYFGFGSTDVYVTADLPDNESAAAAALTISAMGGATVKTVVLLTPEQVDDAAGKGTTYRPPGG